MSEIVLDVLVYTVAVLVMFTWIIIKGDRDDD